MTASLRHAAGSLLVVGLSGAELTALERAWLRLVRPAGIILFRRNVLDAAQTRALLHDAAAHCTSNSLRCVDLDGGSVDRLRDALAPMPSAQAVASAAEKTGNNLLIRRHGELVASAARAFGFNTTLAPVLDLALPASANIMGTRTAASTPEEVTSYARNFLAGLAARGIVGCGKHFPGLGAGARDSHLETPAIHRSSQQLWRQDLLPYRELRDSLQMVMVNHAAYPDTQSRNRPASVSPYWITSVLRKRIGYRGIIFSDDLEMGGILKIMPIEQAAIESVRAGMDLLEICHSPELIIRAYESLLSEAEKSAAFRATLLMRAKLTAGQRQRLYAGSIPRALTSRQFEALRSQILRFTQIVADAQPSPEAKTA
jgi:beta-N-acetylhexosaminidase